MGVIVPWNYPLYLAMGPLTAALAAGNRVLIKMSESTPATAEAFTRLLADVFTEEQVAVITGEAEVGEAFSRLPLDHLLFTGGTGIGRHVMRAAADNLTPVTLELGGKSPAIVSLDVPIDDAAERIAFGKGVNAGQTCVAPGYVEDARSKGAQVIELNPSAEDFSQTRVIPPTLLLSVNDDMKVMQDEIFGPLLPILPYDSMDQAMQYIADRPRPLALYYFGYDKAEQQRLMEQTHAGGMCINDTILHVAQDDLPFGGVGPSGMGHYHGHEGFLTFSKAKGVYIKQRFNGARPIYPPYGGLVLKLIYKLFIR